LTANDTAVRGSVFDVRYELSQSANVTFYYDTDTDPAGRQLAEAYVSTPIGPGGTNIIYVPTVMRAYPSYSRVFRWDLTNVTPGFYYLCADVSDEYNTVTWCSETTVNITSS
jgi:hypothetical protein